MLTTAANLVDVPAQRGRPMDIAASFRWKIHSFAESQSAVERCADFVADIGRKLLLETAVVVGLLSCPDEFPLNMLLHGISRFKVFKRLAELGTMVAGEFE